MKKNKIISFKKAANEVAIILDRYKLYKVKIECIKIEGKNKKNSKLFKKYFSYIQMIDLILNSINSESLKIIKIIFLEKKDKYVLHYSSATFYSKARIAIKEFLDYIS